jgi:hypothetical protein
MSRSNQPPTDKILLEAVELRMAGLKWEIVAEKLHRAFDTVRKWPMRYPDRWQAAIEQAEQRLTIDSNAESVLVLRNMLRAEDIKMRWHAAKTLVGLRVDLGKLGVRLMLARNTTGANGPNPLDDPAFRYFQSMQSLSDEALKELVDGLRPSNLERLGLDQDGHALPGTGDGGDSGCITLPAAHDHHDQTLASSHA